LHDRVRATVATTLSHDKRSCKSRPIRWRPWLLVISAKS